MEKLEVLQKSVLFENLLPEEFEYLAEISQVKEYKIGDIIFYEAEPGNSLYVIIEGEVEILRKDAEGKLKPIAVLKAGDFFGEMSLIDKEMRSATARAKTDVKALVLTSENLHSFAKIYRNGFTMVVINIARVMSKRLRETNNKLAAKL
ncbi:MAG: cyclic nucleotide-binding domain-containing protein [Deltaproteobacteria bacterium]|nr:cyclic nucleotide-binding domain-containing protein [Deltaproteobacteria bacterium]